MHLSLLVTACALFAQPLIATSVTYCAKYRTGDSSAIYAQFQSHGACEKSCASYEFGIVQGYNCWCSNVAPGDTVSTSECNQICPGYGQEKCGNVTLGLYGYLGIYADGSVTTTEFLSTSTSTKTSKTSSISTSKSSTQTSTKVIPTITTSDVTTTSGSTIALETNASGQVKTVTVPASTATAGLEISGDSTTSKKGLSGGAIAGIVIGVLGGLALVGALIFMVFFYRRRARTASPVPSQDMADRTSQGSSFSHGVFAQGPTSLARKGTFTDNRLKTTIYPNGPRDSSVSLQDNEDYSRPVLRLTNPD